MGQAGHLASMTFLLESRISAELEVAGHGCLCPQLKGELPSAGLGATILDQQTLRALK